jgi:hypothetical protein
MDVPKPMELLLIIVVVLVLFGGGGYWGSRSRLLVRNVVRRSARISPSGGLVGKPLVKAQRPDRSTIERRVLQGHAAEGGYLGFSPFILRDARFFRREHRDEEDAIVQGIICLR